MLHVPSTLRTQFEGYLRTQGVPNTEQAAYAKWLGYYLDFCRKYHFPEEHRESLAHFLHKLEEKKQTKEQQHPEPGVQCALVFYRHVLNKNFNKIEEVIRAKGNPS